MVFKILLTTRWRKNGTTEEWDNRRRVRAEGCALPRAPPLLPWVAHRTPTVRLPYAYPRPQTQTRVDLHPATRPRAVMFGTGHFNEATYITPKMPPSHADKSYLL